MNRYRKCGFTLIEIMIVVAIIGLLAAVAIPAFAKARENAQAKTVAKAIQVLADTVGVWSIAAGVYPADAPMATVPIGMEAKDFKVDWSQPTELGGYWDFDSLHPQCLNARAAISIFGAGQDPNNSSFIAVDEIIDDGDLTTGSFRATADRYTYIIEQ